jgi:signal transduction histidine kinase
MRRTQSRADPAERPVVDWSLLEDSKIVATIALTLDARIVAANARMRELLAIGAAERLDGRSFTEFLVQPDEWSSWAQARDAEATSILRLRSAAGTAVTLRGEIRTKGPVLCGLFVNAGDETQLRAAVQHGARMEALGSLTAGIAHDFNNLLTVLVGNLYLVAEELRDRPKTFEKLKSARDASKRGADLIKQLLAFARREQLETAVIDPCKVVAEIEPLLRRALGSKVALRVELQRDAGKIRASAAQLESVLVNLAINARDAIEAKGAVTIGVKRTHLGATEAAARGLAKAGDYVTVSVADDGGGIPPDAIDKVFEPFYSTKRDRGGTGLGLSMVRWFAEQAAGAVALESAVGRGTTVALSLPLCAEQSGVEQNDKTMPLSTLPTGEERIVVLAPEEAVRSTVRQILEVLGYTVDLAAGDEDMIAVLGAKAGELLIVDGPARDDLALLARARSARPNLKIVVMVEGQRPRDRGSQPGISMLAKPFTLAELAATVRHSLDARGSGA